MSMSQLQGQERKALPMKLTAIRDDGGGGGMAWKGIRMLSGRGRIKARAHSPALTLEVADGMTV